MHAKDLELIVFNSGTPEDEVEQELFVSNANGLMTIGDGDELLVVCLVTKKSIYIFDPRSPDSIDFLSRQLKKRNLKIFTVNGPLDSIFLNENLGIRMDKQYDLVNLEVQMYIRHTTISKVIHYGYKDICTQEAVSKKVKSDLEKLDYRDLVYKYLAFDTDLEFSQDELRALRSLPIIETKARIALMRCLSPLQLLASRMLATYEGEKNQPMKAMIRFCKADNQLSEEYEGRQDPAYSQLGFYLEKLDSEIE